MNKVRVFVFCIMLGAVYGQAQESWVDSLLAVPERVVPVYAMDTLFEHIEVPMGYGESEVRQRAVLDSLVDFLLAGEHFLYKVDLVYTNHPRGADLTRLNGRRLRLLYEYLEAGAYRESVKVEVVRQDSCRNYKEASALFHGFVLYYIDGGKRWSSEWDGSEVGQKDSVLYQIAARNGWVGDSMLLVVDMTGSMDRNVSVLMLWLKELLRGGRSVNFVTFIDTAEHRPPGSRGEVFAHRVTGYMEAVAHIDATIKRRKQRNSNYKPEENDVEALVKGLAAFPNSKEVILVADYNGAPHDLVLLRYLKRPVKVVLAGDFLNEEVFGNYASLAIQTGGSIHTIGEDFANMKDIKEGDTFLYKNFVMKYDKGRVFVVKEIKKF